MATIKYSALTSQGAQLTTQLNALGSATMSAAGPTYDNTTNRDRWGMVEVVISGTYTPTAGASYTVYLVNSLDGTNFDDGASSTDPGSHEIVATLAVKVASSISPRATSTFPFPLPPTKFKFVLKNGSGATLPANNSSVLNLYTFNETVV